MQLRNLLWAASGTEFFFLSGNTIKVYDSYQRDTRQVGHVLIDPTSLCLLTSPVSHLFDLRPQCENQSSSDRGSVAHPHE